MIHQICQALIIIMEKVTKFGEDAEFKRYEEIELTEEYGASHFIGEWEDFHALG